MTKETWAQFAQRVKPTHGQVFEDAYGTEWVYDDHNGLFYLVGNSAPCFPDSTCPLADAIEHFAYVEKPKLKKVTLYAYLYLNAHTWIKSHTSPHRRIYDESGTWMTKEIWVEE